jgi:hypothetical protein
MNKRWFGGKTPAEAGVSLVYSLFSPLFGPAYATEPLAPAPAANLSDSSDTIWTASLHRADGLPPFLLSINMVAGSCSAMKFQTQFETRAAERACGDSLRPEL